MVCRKTNWARQHRAVSLLVDLSEQTPIEGLGDPRLTEGSISRDEAPEILQGLCEALGMDQEEFMVKLSRAYTKRCRKKGQLMDWDE